MKKLLLGVVSMVAAGCAADSNNALTTGVANGTVGEWAELSPMPHGRANHCTAFVDGWLLAIGGNYKPEGASDFATSDLVHAARVNGDGSIGGWSVAGTLPSAVSGCTATVDGKRLLVMGGLWDVAANGEKVWAAAISESGELGTFAPIGDLPAGATILMSEAFTTPSEILLFDSELPDEGDETFLLHAPLGTTVGAWERQTLSTRFLGYPQFAFDGLHAIVAGGYLGADDANAVVSDVSVATVGSGAPAGESAESMPKARAFGRAVAIDDHLFVLGGKDALFGSGEEGVYSAPLDAAGKPYEWTTQRPLPEGRTSFGSVVAGDYLYVVGGGSDGPGLDTVYAARVRW